MRCLFAVSSRFVQPASLTVNIDLSDVTNRYYTVLYRTVVVYEKIIRSLVFSGSRKIPTLGSTIQWETRQASFPTGTVGPGVGTFLSSLNTNDGFYLSHISLTNPSCFYPFERILSHIPHSNPCCFYPFERILSHIPLTNPSCFYPFKRILSHISLTNPSCCYPFERILSRIPLTNLSSFTHLR